ncbi:FKBP-type peptidyl-prolyl cis-trans isomerase [Sphingobacterium thalpophilum]|uniref:FKBP-type peptidyl-prolyl cis-trans isomerase n=1 Tax=Sphingobacterium thalpophilum TaxID=259 RepID=UPI003DA66F3C
MTVQLFPHGHLRLHQTRSATTEKGLQKGAKIHIMVPSRCGYGNRSNGKIPANSPLGFVIEVVDIK